MASEDAKQQQWLPLEANPDVMNKFIRRMGVKSSDVEYTDVFGLDAELLAMVPTPVLAVMLLFPINDAEEEYKDQQNARIEAGTQPSPDNVFIMRQTISNACGTIGLVHSIGNNLDAIELEEGSYLDKFFKEAKGKNRIEVGEIMERATDISEAHEEAANEGQTRPPNPDEAVLLHFVCFVQRDGRLYELDGRKAGALDHGPTSPETLLEDSAKVVRQFMERNPTDHNFAVVALSKV